MDSNGGLPGGQAEMILKEIRELRRETIERVDKIETALVTQSRAISRIDAQVEAHSENIDMLFGMLRKIAKEKGVPKPPRGVAVPKEEFYREAEACGINRRQALRELSRADVIVRSCGKNTVACRLGDRVVRVILMAEGDKPCRD